MLTAPTGNQVEPWALRNLGFTADAFLISTLNTALTDPLESYDVVFNTVNWPSAANPLARTRLTAFFARGGGYLGAGANGGNFLTNGAQLVGLTAVFASGNGRSGILYWANTGGAGESDCRRLSRDRHADRGSSDVVHDVADDAHRRCPSAERGDPRGRAVADGSPVGVRAGSAVIAHGTNAAGTARVTLFANNPLYRADPEREWPSLGAAAYWVDQ